ncbi:MAG: hypothetical protein U1G07_07625 [Verrucomicrobiota bacterium]
MSMQPSTNHGAGADLPPWADCEFFCIQDYAGTSASPCRWRGKLPAAAATKDRTRLVCPRCGRPTLFRVPLLPPDDLTA